MLEQADYNRLRWRARRGMLELDLILLPFFDAAFMGLASDEQALFVRLLEREDPELHRWFSRKAQAPDPAMQRLVERILAFNAASQATSSSAALAACDSAADAPEAVSSRMVRALEANRSDSAQAASQAAPRTACSAGAEAEPKGTLRSTRTASAGSPR